MSTSSSVRAMPPAPRRGATTPATHISRSSRASRLHFLVELPDDRGRCPRRPGSEGLWPPRAMPPGPQHSSFHLPFPWAGTSRTTYLKTGKVGSRYRYQLMESYSLQVPKIKNYVIKKRAWRIRLTTLTSWISPNTPTRKTILVTTTCDDSAA